MYMFVNLDEFWGFPKVNYQKIIFRNYRQFTFQKNPFREEFAS